MQIGRPTALAYTTAGDKSLCIGVWQCPQTGSPQDARGRLSTCLRMSGAAPEGRLTNSSDPEAASEHKSRLTNSSGLLPLADEPCLHPAVPAKDRCAWRWAQIAAADTLDVWNGLTAHSLQTITGHVACLGGCTFGGVLERTVVDGAQDLGLQKEVTEACRTGRDVAGGRLSGLCGSAFFLLRRRAHAGPSLKPAKDPFPAQTRAKGFDRGGWVLLAQCWRIPCRSQSHTGEDPHQPCRCVRRVSRTPEQS